MNKVKFAALAWATFCLSLGYKSSRAADFNPGIGDLSIAWVTNVTTAAGLRTKNPSCSLTGDPNSGGGS